MLDDASGANGVTDDANGATDGAAVRYDESEADEDGDESVVGRAAETVVVERCSKADMAAGEDQEEVDTAAVAVDSFLRH